MTTRNRVKTYPSRRVEGRTVAATSLVVALISLTACRAELAPAPTIEFVVADRAIPVLADLALVEPRPAINPWDPDHLVIATIAASPSGRDSGWTCLVLSTLDGGGSWTEANLGIDRCIDPWVEFTARDSLLAAAIAISRDTTGEGRLGLVSYRSGDRGRSWIGMNTLIPGFEHPILAADGDSAMTLIGRKMTRTTTGDVRHGVYVGHVSDRADAIARLSESRPAGTGSELTEITPTGLARLSGGRVVASLTGGGEAWAVHSNDGGVVFGAASLITDGCAGGGAEDGFAGWPTLTVDAGRDRLYHACVRSGFAGVEVRHSTDEGATWSPAVLLGVDTAAASPPSAGPPHARTSMLAANEDGVLAVAWFDRRNDPDSACQDIVFTVSRDGGESFAPPRSVSSERSCPSVGRNGWVAESWEMGGDYSSLIAGPNGDFLLVWADSRTGRFALRYALLRVSP